MAPGNLLYSKTHEWLRLETDSVGRKIGVVGVTDFALHVLTDLVFLGLPEVGRKVQAGEPFGEIESVKAVSDLNSPVTGEVVEVNAAIAEKLEQLTADPFGAGWMVKIALSGAAPADLLDAAAYQKQCDAEAAEH